MKRQWIAAVALMVIVAGCEQPSAKSAMDQAKAAKAEAAAVKADASSDVAAVEAEKSSATNPDVKTAAQSELDADSVLNDAIAAAKADDKALFVHFGADW